MPFHVYPALVFDGSGYEPSVAHNVKVVGDLVRNRSLTRDWASLEGGATLKSFTPPDYGPFCGTNANGAFDLSFGAGWPSDSVTNGSSGVSGPRKTVVQLPAAVDVSTFGVVSGGTCGDGPEAGVKAFTIETRKNANAPWQHRGHGERPQRRAAPRVHAHRGSGRRAVRPVHDAVEPRRRELHGRPGGDGSRDDVALSACG